MTVIPTNARVIEFGGGEWPVTVAQSRERGAVWAVTDVSRLYVTAELESRVEREGNLRVLATFPEPTLAEIVGDADVFTFESRSHGDACVAWRKKPGVWSSSEYIIHDIIHECATLDDAQAQWGIDLSTVTPLVPRGES